MWVWCWTRQARRCGMRRSCCRRCHRRPREDRSRRARCEEARTDDRGMYELPNLAPGDYRLSVTAQPWYAAGRKSAKRRPTNDPSGLDPSLDFAYPADMVSGSGDAARAETITLHAGDTRQADFQFGPDSVDSSADSDAAAGADGSEYSSRLQWAEFQPAPQAPVCRWCSR